MCASAWRFGSIDDRKKINTSKELKVWITFENNVQYCTVCVSGQSLNCINKTPSTSTFHFLSLSSTSFTFSAYSFFSYTFHRHALVLQSTHSLLLKNTLYNLSHIAFLLNQPTQHKIMFLISILSLSQYKYP